MSTGNGARAARAIVSRSSCAGALSPSSSSPAGTVPAGSTRSSTARTFAATASAPTRSSAAARPPSIMAPGLHRAAIAPIISPPYRSGSAA
jgi:hypothetical protein